MPTGKSFDIQVTRDRDSGGVRLQVTSDRLPPEGSHLSFVMTPDGLVIDHIDEHGDCIKSLCRMWDELEDLFEC